jgi:PatG C-terminal
VAKKATSADGGNDDAPQPSRRSALPTAAPSNRPWAASSCTACDQQSLIATRSPERAQLVYTVGRLTAQFSTIGVQREFALLAEGAYQGGEVEVGLLREVLAHRDNAYLGRHLCWILTTQGIESISVVPRDDTEVARFLEVIAPHEEEELVHIVVGKTTTLAADSPCAMPGLPTVEAELVLAFTPAEFAQGLLESKTSEGHDSSEASTETDQAKIRFALVVREVFFRLTRGMSNRGFTDDHRARNYVATRYPEFYQAVIRASQAGKAFVGIDARHIHSADRRIVLVGFALRHPRSDVVERHHCLVDVTEVFPFLITGLQPTYD